MYITLSSFHSHLKWPVVLQQNYKQNVVHVCVHRWVFICFLKMLVYAGFELTKEGWTPPQPSNPPTLVKILRTIPPTCPISSIVGPDSCRATQPSHAKIDIRIGYHEIWFDAMQFRWAVWPCGHRLGLEASKSRGIIWGGWGGFSNACLEAGGPWLKFWVYWLSDL